MDDRLASILILLGAFIAAVAAIGLYNLKSRKQRQQAQLDAQDRQDELVRMGLLTSEGYPACIVCGVTASKYMPVSGVSWMDNLPLLNRLFSLPPRYVIVDNVQGDLCLCRAHHSVATKKLEEFHAVLRAERARFNSSQEERVAAIDGGELMKIVMEQHSVQLDTLKTRTSDSPTVSRLVERTEEEIIDTTVVSAGASIPPEE